MSPSNAVQLNGLYSMVVLGAHLTTHTEEQFETSCGRTKPFPQSGRFGIVQARAGQLRSSWVEYVVAERVVAEGQVGDSAAAVADTLETLEGDLARTPKSASIVSEVLQATRIEQALYVRDSLRAYLSSIGCAPTTGGAVGKGDAPLLRVASLVAAMAILLTRHWANGISAKPLAADQFGRFAPVSLDCDHVTGSLDAGFDFWMKKCLTALDKLEAASPDRNVLCRSLRQRLLRLAAEVISDEGWWRDEGADECISPEDVKSGLCDTSACRWSPQGTPQFDSEYTRGVTGDHLDWMAMVTRHLLLSDSGVHLNQNDLAIAIALAPSGHEARIRTPALGEATHLSEVSEGQPRDPDGNPALALMLQALKEADAAQGPSGLYVALAWHALRACSMRFGSSFVLSFCHDRMFERALTAIGSPYALVLPVHRAGSGDRSWALFEVTASGEVASAEPTRILSGSDSWLEDVTKERPVVVKMLGSPLFRLPAGMQHRVAIGELSMMKAFGPSGTLDLQPLFQWVFHGPQSDLEGCRPEPKARIPFFLGFDAWSSLDRLEYYRVLEAWDPEEDPRRVLAPTRSRGFDTPEVYYLALRLDSTTPLSRGAREIILEAASDIEDVLASPEPALKGIAASAKELICVR